jgi:hypothetical protein
MVRALIIVCISAAAACTALAQSPTPVPKDAIVRISMPQSRLIFIIKFYQTLTRRRTWIDAQLGFEHPIDLVSQRDMPRDEAVQFIRDTLRKEGIEIREVGDSEAYVSRAAP